MKVTIKFTAKDGIGPSRVEVDDQPVLDGSGEVTVDLPPGKHALTWFVRGVPGSTYVIEITAPDGLKWKHEGTIDQTGEDEGVQHFTVPKDGGKS